MMNMNGHSRALVRTAARSTALQNVALRLALLGATACASPTNTDVSGDAGQTSTRPDARQPAEGGAVAANATPDSSGAPIGDGESEGCEPSCGPSTADFFDNDRLASVYLTVDPSETKAAGYAEDEWLLMLWERWSVCALNPQYTSVTLQYVSEDGIGDSVLQNVGLRLRGTKSRGFNDLQGLKLNYQTLLDEGDTSDRGDSETDAGADDPKRRRFADMNQLNLLSVENDKSLMLQCAAYKYVRNFGVPAPRCNHLKVFINGEYYALMQNVEKVDDGRFLRHYFGDTKGPLYECSGGCSRELPDGTIVQFPDSKATLEYAGDKFEGEYLSAYNPLRGNPQPEKELIPMLKCGDERQTPDDAEFKRCIQEWIDVDEWLRLIAAESIMPSLESFMVKRNYHLYFRPDFDATTSPHGGHFVLYSWDYDTALNKQGCSSEECDVFSATTGFDTGGSRPLLAKRLMRVFKEKTCETMYRFLDEVYTVDVIDDMAAGMEAAMAEVYDRYPDKAVYPEESSWQDAVSAMHDFVSMRSEVARQQLDAECGPGAATGPLDAGAGSDSGAPAGSITPSAAGDGG
jgi:spore coat protein CotH